MSDSQAHEQPSARPTLPTAATNVPELISELDAGMFERLLSIALSQTAAACIDHAKVGEVTIKFKVEQIPGTHQVRMGHTMKFTKPTRVGKSSEETEGATVLYVGVNGRLSLAQPSLLDKARQTNLPA